MKAHRLQQPALAWFSLLFRAKGGFAQKVVVALSALY
jgi:hypothetical protein